MSRTLVAMSGGVDSAVAAYLVKKSCDDVAGITLQMFDRSNPKFAVAQKSENEADSARKIASLIGIPHHIYNCETEFKKYVIDSFISSYLNGETPNPCVVCNKNIKFGVMRDAMQSLGYDKIATGHYAQIEQSESGRYLLKKAVDEKKDQSYVLYTLSQEQLSRALFPLGKYTKDEIRGIAQSLNFENANKQDSQDICFVPDGDFFSFICRYSEENLPNGIYVNRDGQILGTSEHAAKYTIGQRKGLGIALGQPMFVVSKNMIRNSVTLGVNSELFSKNLDAYNINFIPFDTLSSKMKVKAKIRYKQTAEPATIEQTSNNTFHLEFDSPQRAITPGQSVVLYDDDYVIGGGIIS